jgi:hypothetical protein
MSPKSDQFSAKAVVGVQNLINHEQYDQAMLEQTQIVNKRCYSPTRLPLLSGPSKIELGPPRSLELAMTSF